MTNEQGTNTRSDMHTWRRTVCIVLVLIILFFIFTSAILASRLVELAGRSERPVLLEVGKGGTLEIFKIEYENGNGKVTVRGAKAQKIVAPGTDNTSFIYYENADSTAIDYTLKPGVTFHSEEYRIPLEVRLIGPDGNYIVGSADAWEPVESLNSTPVAENTIGKGKEAVYTLEWKWAFRSENPEDIAYDTLLGDAAAAGENVGLEISFTTQATANTSVDANGGFAKSGMLGNVAFGILWILLLVALILLIIALVKGKKDPTDDATNVAGAADAADAADSADPTDPTDAI